MPAKITDEAGMWEGGDLPEDLLTEEAEKFLNEIRDEVKLAMMSLFNREVTENVRCAFEAFANEGAWGINSRPPALEWHLHNSELWGGDELPVRIILTPDDIVQAMQAEKVWMGEDAQAWLPWITAFRDALDKAEAIVRASIPDANAKAK